MNILLLIIILTAASFIQTSAGFGFSMVALSLMTFSLPILTSSVIIILSMVPLTLFMTLRNAKKINWKISIIPFISAIITTQIGIRLLMISDNTFLLRLLGAILIIISLFSIFSNSNRKIMPTMPVQIIFGTLSGLLSGLFNIGGPPMAIYMFAAAADKEEYNSTLQMFFLATAIIAVISHLIYGNITKEVLSYIPYAYIGVALGTSLGLAFFKRLSSEKIKKLVYGVMMVMGCVVLIRG